VGIEAVSLARGIGAVGAKTVELTGTYIGQIAMLRRLAGCPIKGENFFKAEIIAGRVGSEQAAPRREFD